MVLLTICLAPSILLLSSLELRVMMAQMLLQVEIHDGPYNVIKNW